MLLPRILRSPEGEEAPAPAPADAAPEGGAVEVPAAEPAPAPDVDAIIAKHEAAQADLQQKLQRALAGSQRSDRSAHDSRKEIESLKERLSGSSSAKELLDAYIADPSKLWADGHLTEKQLLEINRGHLKGDLSVSTAADKELVDLRARVEKAEADLAARAKGDTDREASAGFERDVGHVRGMIDAEDGGFPLLATFDRAESVVHAIHREFEKTGEEVTRDSVQDLLRQSQAVLEADIIKALGSEAGLRVALAHDETKTRIIEALKPPADDVTDGAEPAPQAAGATGNGSSALTPERVAETGTRRREPKARANNRANAVQAVKDFHARRKENSGVV